MFENENENLVTEVTENVEQTTEETPKTYTQEEFDSAVNSKVDEVLGKKIARREAKIRKEYERKYGDLEDVLKAGTGKENVGEITDTFKEFYTKKGIQMPEKPKYTDDDIAVLASADADEIIRGGYDEVVEEMTRLTELGAANMTAREKAVFQALGKYRTTTEKGRELAKLGVTEDVYNSPEFNEFASQFNENVSMERIYNLYAQTLPKKEKRTPGSMKNNDSADNGVKDYYSPEEARRFTKADLDKNPALMAAIEKSMTKWSRKS
jgi:hypothetical protein